MSYIKYSGSCFVFGYPADGAEPADGDVIVYDGTLKKWKVQPSSAVTKHDLLDGNIDQDTVAHTVTRGDIIVGDSTPRWNALAASPRGSLLKMGALDPAWLGIGTSNQYLKTDGTDPLWSDLLLADLTNPGGASGDIIYFDGTNWVRLPKGSPGQILQTGTPPSWVTPGTGFTGTQITHADPTNLSGTTMLMFGLGDTWVFTPSKTGKLKITVMINIFNNSATNGNKVQIAYGTGAAPANGSAATGTLLGIEAHTFDAENNFGNCITLTAIVTGLALSTQIWIDLQAAAFTSGTTYLKNSLVIIEEYTA